MDVDINREAIDLLCTSLSFDNCPDFSLNNFSCPNIGCNRVNLNPCDYANMGEYANIICCELNKFVNGPCNTACLFPSNCYFVEKCIKILTPPDYLVLHPHSNPLKYCGAASCGEYSCPTFLPPPNDFYYCHLPLSITDQDILIDWAKLIAQHEREYVECQGNVTGECITFYSAYEYTPPLNCFNNHPYLCTNMYIAIKIKYYCCNSEDK